MDGGRKRLKSAVRRRVPRLDVGELANDRPRLTFVIKRYGPGYRYLFVSCTVSREARPVPAES